MTNKYPGQDELPAGTQVRAMEMPKALVILCPESKDQLLNQLLRLQQAPGFRYEVVAVYEMDKEHLMSGAEEIRAFVPVPKGTPLSRKINIGRQLGSDDAKYLMHIGTNINFEVDNLRFFVECLKTNPDIGIISSKEAPAAGTQPEIRGLSIDLGQYFGVSVKAFEEHVLDDDGNFMVACGDVVTTPLKLWDQLGGFPTVIGKYSDLAYQARVRLLGYRFLTA